MTIAASMQWWVRGTDGNALNGGGYDSTVSGATNNYADQSGPQVTFDGSTVTATTSGVSAVITITGYTVTGNEKGNVLRIASGTNYTAAYYRIDDCSVGSNTWTLDRNVSTGSGSGLVGRMGGAFATWGNLASSGVATLPTLTTPLVAGNRINVRGAGSDSPSAADYIQAGYYTFPAGDATNGYVGWLGYNGRPRIDPDGLFHFNSVGHRFENFYIKPSNTNSVPNVNGYFNSGVNMTNVVFDMNGKDGIAILTCGHVVDCAFINSGATTASTTPTLTTAQYGSRIVGCTIRDQRGYGVLLRSMGSVEDCLIFNNKSTSKGAIEVTGSSIGWQMAVMRNTIHGNGYSGVNVTNSAGVSALLMMNNTITGNGGYGVELPNSAAANDRLLPVTPDYNNYGTGGTANTSGARSNLTAGSHDLVVDPGFANTSGGDYSVGTNLKAVGFPGAFRGSSTTGYLDIGGAQRQESGGGSTVIIVEDD